MRVRLLSVVALMTLGLSPAAHADGIKELDDGKVRIKFSFPGLPERAVIKAVQDDSKDTLRLFDSVYLGNVEAPNQSAYFAQYFTTSNAWGFSYTPVDEAVKSIFRSDRFKTTVTSGPKGSLPSAFGSVDYVSISVERLADGAKRDCGAWYYLFGGNKIGYSGVFCPAGHAPSISEIGAAVGAVTLR